MVDLNNIVSEGEDRLDLTTGYFTRKSFDVDSKACKLYENTVTELVKDTKHIFKNKVWYLTTITLPGGILFPDGTPEQYNWVVAPIASIDSTDQHPIPDKPGEFYQTRVAIEGAKKFDQFKEGLVYLGMQ